MRHYHTDSPEAMARIVALALLADGGLDKSEIETLENDAIVEQIGLNSTDFDRVLQDFCNDLMTTSMVDSSGQLGLDRAATDHLLTDIHAPELQIQMLHILLDLVSADGRLTPGEAHVVSQAMTRWGLEINSSTPTRERNLGRRPTQVQHLQRAA